MLYGVGYGLRDLTGTHMSFQQMVEAVKIFNLQEMLGQLSWLMQILFCNTVKNAQEVQWRLARELFEPSIMESLIRHRREDTEWRRKRNLPISPMFIFRDISILRLMSVAIFYCNPRAGRAFTMDQDFHLLGRLLLAINDEFLQHGREISEQKNWSELTLKEKCEILGPVFLPQDALPHGLNFSRSLPRYQQLYQELPYVIRQEGSYTGELIDVSGEIEQITGVTYDEYLAIGLGFLTRWYGKKLDEVNTVRGPIYLSAWFSKTKFEPNHFRILSRLFISDIETWKNEYIESMRFFADPLYNHLPFQKFPLLKTHGDLIFCLHPDYLISKMTSGILWPLSERYRFQKRESRMDDVFRSLGFVFERYIQNILESIYSNEMNRLHIMRRNNKIKLPDFVIIYNNALIVIESKTSRIPLQKKFGASMDDFLKTFQERYLLLDGAKQIDSWISAFKNGDYYIEGVNPKNITRFYPILLSLDSIPRNPALIRLYDDILKSDALLQGSHIAPLEIIDIEEMEMLEPLLKKESFVKILCNKNDVPNNRIMEMRDFLSSTYYRAGELINERLDSLYSNCIQNLISRCFDMPST